MLEVVVPGAQPLRFAHLVADFNGTLAIDGVLIAGVAEALRSLSGRLEIHVVTADTLGVARHSLDGLPCTTIVLSPGDQDSAKLRYVEGLGAARCVCIGNGRNDRLMLASAKLNIEKNKKKETAVEELIAERVAGLLLNPARLVATLRV